jgi:hypothetical protein
MTQPRVDESPEGAVESYQEKMAAHLRKTHFEMKLAKLMERIEVYEDARRRGIPLTDIGGFQRAEP